MGQVGSGGTGETLLVVAAFLANRACARAAEPLSAGAGVGTLLSLKSFYKLVFTYFYKINFVYEQFFTFVIYWSRSKNNFSEKGLVKNLLLVSDIPT
jgi:hypothetical protein